MPMPPKPHAVPRSRAGGYSAASHILTRPSSPAMFDEGSFASPPRLVHRPSARPTCLGDNVVRVGSIAAAGAGPVHDPPLRDCASRSRRTMTVVADDGHRPPRRCPPLNLAQPAPLPNLSNRRRSSRSSEVFGLDRQEAVRWNLMARA